MNSSQIVNNHDLPTLGSSSTLTPAPQTTPIEDKIAKSASSFATMSDSLNGYAYGQLSKLASSTLEEWLKQYGNARINLNTQTENNQALADSSADLLFGLHNQENRLDYIQFDTHYQDSDDMIVNVGLGQRYFLQNQSMLGYNIFYDRNMSSDVTRTGVGIELWRDYFKFSGNGYFALSDWQNSDELQDYDEKAADGYDLQIEAYLPSYAQLGGHLKYEQYFGDDVALFSTDHLQTNPKAITIGVSYTPIPLVTFTGDYKKGSDSLDDTIVSASFNYAFGVPWSQQISPDAVQVRRSLMGSRFDFVDRNSDIVMQYRKQEVIKLSLPTSVNGKVSTVVDLIASVEAKNGLSYIQWDSSSSLLKAGGVVTPGSDATHFKVTLPPVAGQYTLKGTAYDRHNNASNSAQTQFTVSDQSSGNLQLTFKTPETAWIDRPEALSVVVTDAAGKPAPETSITFSTNKDCSNCTFSETEVTAKEQDGTAVASTTLYDPGRGTITVTACVTGTDDCTDQLIDFYVPPKLDGQVQLKGKQVADKSLPSSWISNTQFELGFTATGGDDSNYIWESSNEDVATVDQNGEVTIKDKLGDFTISITSLGRKSDDANSLHIAKGNEMLHVTSNLKTYDIAEGNCEKTGRKIPELADFQRITALWGNMDAYPTYNAMPKYVWAKSEAVDVGTGYRMKDGATYSNLDKADPEYQGCLE